jgi:hypothetical protein
MLLNGLAQTEEIVLTFPQFVLILSVTCVHLRLITVLGNCGCVAVASFFGVPSPLVSQKGNCLHLVLVVVRDSSVGIATGYRPDNPSEFESQ